MNGGIYDKTRLSYRCIGSKGLKDLEFTLDFYRSNSHNINLLIDRDYPKPPPPDTYRTTFTDLRSGFRSLNREKYLPPFADEIKNFFASHNVEEFKDKIISFNELYLLKAQASKEHYEIGFGDYWLFRIAGFVITDETRFSTLNGEMWRF